jgi:chromosome segregation ATPase
MNTLSVILGFQISIGLLEVIIFQIGAIILGFSIHFFFASRKSINSVHRSASIGESDISEADEWRLKYYEQTDLQKKWEEETRLELENKQEHEHQLRKKLGEARKELEDREKHEYLLSKKLEEAERELHTLREASAAIAAKEDEPAEYLAQLATAQANLSDHNQRITRLLEQIELLKESERKHLDTKQTIETLQMQLRGFRQALSDKEAEIKQIRHQQLLIHELKERLEKARQEYNLLQDKLQKLETHISKPQNRTFEYEELQQSYFKLTKECDEIKIKQLAMLEENQRLSRLFADTEDKLRESNFQRQQYARKIGFLEELNQDLQQLSGHHKKLESQMMRIGEIETMLNRGADNPKSDV